MKQKTDFIIATDGACIDDQRLGLDALAVNVYLKARPISREDLPGDLARRFGCTSDRIRKAVDELVAHGYLQMVRSADGGDAVKYDALVMGPR